MRNLGFSHLRNGIWLACALALTACTKTPVDVSTLGLKVVAPQLKTSPFNQDMDSQGYAEVAGSCNTSVGTLYISLDKISWFGIPATTTYSGTAGSGTKTNDSNCADGTFDFFLTKALITSWVGAAASDIKIFYLHGEGALGNTEDLTVSDGSENNGGNKLNLTKSSPRGYAGAGNCEKFSVGLNDNSTLSLPLSYNLQVGGSNVSFFLTNDDCNDGTNAVTQDSLTVASPYQNLFFSFAGTSVGSTLNFTAVSASLTSAPEGVTIRSSVDRVLKFDTAFNTVYKNTCLPISVTVSQYNGGSYSGFSSATPVVFTTTDPKLKIYSDNICSLQQPISFPAYGTNTVFFARYETSAPDSNSTTWASISVARDPSAATGTEFDAGNAGFNVDLSFRNTITAYQLQMDSNAKVGFCIPIDLSATNFNESVIPVAIARTLTLASTDSGGGFYKSSTCQAVDLISTGNPLTMPSLAASQRFYYKTTTAATASNNILANTGALSLSSLPTPISTSQSFSKATLASSPTYGVCSSLDVLDQDLAGNTILAASLPLENHSLTVQTVSSILFDSADCSGIATAILTKPGSTSTTHTVLGSVLRTGTTNFYIYKNSLEFLGSVSVP